MSAALTPMPQAVSLEALSFGDLVTAIRHVNDELTAQATRAVNTSLTLRNWLIGYYVEAYERRGVDRAQYGEKLMEKLAESLTEQGMSRCDRREIYRYRQFYLTYPQIVESLPPQFALVLETVDSRPPQSQTDGRTLISSLSFTHIVELLNLESIAQRGFYEVQCIEGNWSVRELKRQIHSLYFERCGLSLKPEKLIELVQSDSHKTLPALTVRDPYVFEFLGLTPPEVMSESHLEEQLIRKIEAFLLELGHGFCFEARQKMMVTGDNPPIGILLCTHKSASLAEFALAGMDNQLFVSKYQLELPKREEIERFLAEKLREAGVENT